MAMRPTGYSLFNYGQMVISEPRMSAYAEALAQAITPGCTVFDLGAGPGVFSLVACAYGAGSVVAVDPHPSVRLLSEFARANGFEDRITIFEGLSTEFTPPSKADVIVSDLRASLPLFEGHIPAIVDARERLLKPGGTLIPLRDRLCIGLVEARDEYRPFAEPWLENAFDLDLSAGHRFVVNAFQKVQPGGARLLASPNHLATLDYPTISSPDVTGNFEFEVERSGTAHGLLLWFDAEIAEGLSFSNSPEAPPLVYGQRLYPFQAPVAVTEGDLVAGHISARLLGRDYTWAWQTSFSRAGATYAEFRQSTFLAEMLDRRPAS